MAKYPAPGRGAWRQSGGLLPGRPGGAGRGYYRAAVGTETPVGSAWLREEDAGHDAYCVHLGVKAIQRLVGALADGWFGPATAAAVAAAQARHRVEADAIVGPASMRAFLTPLIQDLATHNAVPVVILGGLLVNESALDPACVGVNGMDHGLAQINLGAHEKITVDQALNVEFAVEFTVNDLSMRHSLWFGRTKADPWDIAIAAHNSPALAKRWAQEGKPPVVAGRPFQIEEYVARVRAAW